MGDDIEKRGFSPDDYRSTAPMRGKMSDKQPKIITLCGSTRFIETVAVMAYLLEKEGAIVLGLHYLPPGYFKGKDIVECHIAEHEGVAEHFDNLHLRKIDLSDSIYVLNVDGYIGESTRREIDYAEKIGKPVTYLES
jgi:hypothetical protein